MNDKYYKRKDFTEGVRSCDIILTRIRNNNPIDMWVRDRICDITKGIVSHAGIIGKQGDIIEATPNGIKINKIQKYINNNDGVFIFRTSLPENYKDIILSYAYIKAKNNSPYDWFGFLNHLFAFIPNNPNTEYCSEFVTQAFMKTKTRVSDVITEKTTPQDLLDFQYKQKAFEKQYSWQLADYQNFNIDEVLNFLNEKWNK